MNTIYRCLSLSFHVAINDKRNKQENYPSPSLELFIILQQLSLHFYHPLIYSYHRLLFNSSKTYIRKEHEWKQRLNI